MDNNNILQKLEGLESRYEEVSTLITDPDVIADQPRYVKLTKEWKDLGDISFPLYIVHYPFMYYFYSWLIKKQLFTLGETWPEALITCAVSIAAAWLCLKFYDLPVRRWLAKK